MCDILKAYMCFLQFPVNVLQEIIFKLNESMKCLGRLTFVWNSLLHCLLKVGNLQVAEGAKLCRRKRIIGVDVNQDRGIKGSSKYTFWEDFAIFHCPKLSTTSMKLQHNGMKKDMNSKMPHPTAKRIAQRSRHFTFSSKKFRSA